MFLISDSTHQKLQIIVLNWQQSSGHRQRSLILKRKSKTSPSDSSNIPSEQELESLFEFNLLANPDAVNCVRPF